MSTAAIATMPVGGRYNSPEFWERLWRTSGIQYVGLFVVTALIYGSQPPVGASPEALDTYYQGHRAWILVAAFLSSLNLLNLLWFTAALRAALADAGQDGWGAAATVASSAFGTLSFLQLAVAAALAYSVAGQGNAALVIGLNDFSWALMVLTSFPRAMLIMAGAFGLWRAGGISNELFAIGVGAVVLGVLGGSTWVAGGAWAPDGAYSRYLSPLLLLAWILVESKVLLTRSPVSRSGW